MLLCRKILDSPRLTIASENRHVAHIEIHLDRNGSHKPDSAHFCQELGEDQGLRIGTCAGKVSADSGCLGVLFNVIQLANTMNQWSNQSNQCSHDTELTSLINWEDLGRYPVKVCRFYMILLCEDKLNKLYDVQGVMLMVVGLPNVGKSTIINGLKQIGFGTARHTGKRIWARHLDPGDSSFDFAKQTLRNFWCLLSVRHISSMSVCGKVSSCRESNGLCRSSTVYLDWHATCPFFSLWLGDMHPLVISSSQHAACPYHDASSMLIGAQPRLSSHPRLYCLYLSISQRRRQMSPIARNAFMHALTVTHLHTFAYICMRSYQ